MALDDTKFYDLVDGPDTGGRQASVGGYWDDNERTAQSAVSLAGTPIVRQHFFGPDYATGDREPGATPILDT
jgi:hypothetical protein